MTQIDGKYDYEVVEFTVEAKSLEGSFAYEADDVNDTSFKFTGIKKEINFADADGNKLVEGEDYDIVSVRDDKGTAIPSGINGVIGAETYIVSIKGTDGGAYEGSTATVTFKVDPIDFENDTFTVKTVKADAASPLFNGTDGTLLDPTIIMVNGEPVAKQVLTAKAVSVDRVDGEPANPSAYIGNVPAKVVLSVSADSSKFSTDNFLGDPTTVEMKVVDKLVENFYYDNEQLGDSSTPADGVFDLTIDASKGESFDPGLITAALEKGGKSLPVDVTVYRDGEETDDYSTPGTLTVSVDVITPNDLSYGGSASLEVTIKGKHYGAEPKVFATVDGKDAKGAKVEYDAEAVEPVVVAKSGSATIDAADYTVTYTDADGEAVEEIVEPGEYNRHRRLRQRHLGHQWGQQRRRQGGLHLHRHQGSAPLRQGRQGRLRLHRRWP